MNVMCLQKTHSYHLSIFKRSVLSTKYEAAWEKNKNISECFWGIFACFWHVIVETLNAAISLCAYSLGYTHKKII